MSPIGQVGLPTSTNDPTQYITKVPKWVCLNLAEGKSYDGGVEEYTP